MLKLHHEIAPGMIAMNSMLLVYSALMVPMQVHVSCHSALEVYLAYIAP